MEKKKLALYVQYSLAGAAAVIGTSESPVFKTKIGGMICPELLTRICATGSDQFKETRKPLRINQAWTAVTSSTANSVSYADLDRLFADV